MYSILTNEGENMEENKLIDIPDRIKYLREKVLKIKQSEMSTRINLQRGSLSDIERKKTKTVTDRVINDICREFSVNENWLKYGNGEIFIKKDTFSLDEYAKQNNISDVELDIIKALMGLDANTRKIIISCLKSIFSKHSETSAAEESNINKKLENYRLELEAEKKEETLSALHQPEENIK